ncbi:MAG: tyrosine-type recombinase/integrase [Promethearchaeota archaeon]
MSQKKVLSRSEENRLIESAPNNQTKLLIETMLKTGMRVSEICNFKIEWINFEDNQILIQKNTDPIEFDPKYGSGRELPISPMLSINLNQLIGKRKKGYVFRSQRKEYPQRYEPISIINKINSLCKKIFGKPLGSHIFRRTYASNLLYSGVNIKTIQKLLGHKHLTTTLVYLKDIPKRDDYDQIRKAISY